MSYRVLKASTSQALEAKVRNLIREGWVAQGGVCHCIEGEWEQWSQAMIDWVEVKEGDDANGNS